mmetsp:Transcript_35857/g.90118  ORF Transcript_35857/g.90118 Transcript_35857/m.90118 type:complete len:484 (+) Transcript_35857:258-1709(+)
MAVRSATAASAVGSSQPPPALPRAARCVRFSRACRLGCHRGARMVVEAVASAVPADNPVSRSPSGGRQAAAHANNRAVHTALATQPRYELPGGRSTVPLLLPGAHGLPFGIALELVTAEERGRAGWTPPEAAPRQGGHGNDDNAYHLYYVMCGNGIVGGAQAVSAGDSVLGLSESRHGPVDIAATGSAAGPLGRWDLVLLRVVFPAAILETEATALEAGPTVEDTAACWMEGSACGATGAALAADLLEGAQTAAQAGLDIAAAATESRQRQAGATSGASTSGAHGGGGWPFPAPPALVAPAAELRRRLGPPLRRHHAAIASLEDHTQRLVGALRGVRRTRLRRLTEVDTFQLPNQTNLLALVFDPLGESPQPFTFGIEVFQPGHETPPHKHDSAYEVFFILSGSGVAFCDGRRFEVNAGDTIVFPPTSVHGIDNGCGSKMYLLELMLPNDAFAEFVRKGQLTGLEDEDLCVLIGRGCGMAVPP